jgi:glutathione S-transferase
MKLADLYLLPTIYYLGLTREGQGALPHYPAIQAWQARMAERPSVQATVPPSFEVLRAVA